MAAKVDEVAEVHETSCISAVFYSGTSPLPLILSKAEVDEGAKV